MNDNRILSKWSVSTGTTCWEVNAFLVEGRLDLRNGGVYTCLDRDGSLIDTTNQFGFKGVLRSHAVMLIIILNRIRSGWLLQKYD